jgi:hypothetical protein
MDELLADLCDRYTVTSSSQQRPYNEVDRPSSYIPPFMQPECALHQLDVRCHVGDASKG